MGSLPQARRPIRRAPAMRVFIASVRDGDELALVVEEEVAAVAADAQHVVGDRAALVVGAPFLARALLHLHLAFLAHFLQRFVVAVAVHGSSSRGRRDAALSVLFLQPYSR